MFVGLRYYLVIANTFGFSSPLTYNVSVVKYAVKEAFNSDLIRFRVRLNRLVIARSKMENANTGVMRTRVSAADLQTKSVEKTMPQEDFVIIPGLASTELQSAKPLGRTQDELDSIWEFLGVWDRALLDNRALRLNYHWRQFLDQDGRPASAPPWAKIVALDLSIGMKNWEVPFGEKIIDGEVRETGSPAYGGLISTSGGIIFATGTDDGYIRALDKANGEPLWRHKMSAAGSAPPITVEFEGKQ